MHLQDCTAGQSCYIPLGRNLVKLEQTLSVLVEMQSLQYKIVNIIALQNTNDLNIGVK